VLINDFLSFTQPRRGFDRASSRTTRALIRIAKFLIAALISLRPRLQFANRDSQQSERFRDFRFWQQSRTNPT
jgi:hypothetical protein